MKEYATKVERDDDERYISRTWLIATLIGILMLLGAGGVTSVVTTINNKLDRAEYLKDYQRRNEDIAMIKAEQANINSKLDSIYSRLDGLPDLKKLMENHINRSR